MTFLKDLKNVRSVLRSVRIESTVNLIEALLRLLVLVYQINHAITQGKYLSRIVRRVVADFFLEQNRLEDNGLKLVIKLVNRVRFASRAGLHLDSFQVLPPTHRASHSVRWV